MAQIGTGKYTYELVCDFLKSPDGEPFGLVSRVAADARDRIYVFQRRDPPVVVFDREGKYLRSWGSGEVTDPHGLKIVGDVVYTTARSDSVAKSFTLDGKPQLELGQPIGDMASVGVDAALAELQQGLAVQGERLRDRVGAIGRVDHVTDDLQAVRVGDLAAAPGTQIFPLAVEDHNGGILALEHINAVPPIGRYPADQPE